MKVKVSNGNKAGEWTLLESFTYKCITVPEGS